MKMADSTAPGPSASSNHQQDHSFQDYIETSQMLAILCIDSTKICENNRVVLGYGNNRLKYEELRNRIIGKKKSIMCSSLPRMADSMIQAHRAQSNFGP